MRELHALFSQPYEELAGELEAKYYRRAGRDVAARGGTAFMS